MGSRKTRGPSPNSKSEFIRSQPADMSAAEIVERGKAAGHTLTAMFVHNIRSRARAKAGASKPEAKMPKGAGRALSIARRAAEARAKLASRGAAAPVAEAAPVKRGPGRSK